MSNTSIDKVPILTTAYLPPIDFFASIYRYKKLLLEGCESYQKQSYRNRCNILTANGSLSLIIPIDHSCNRSSIKEVKIDNSSPWQIKHWRAILSAYKSSPFFDFYDLYLEPFFTKRYNFLFDFNLELLLEIIDLLNIGIDIEVTTNYNIDYDSSYLDFRNSFHPKQSAISLSLKNMSKYHQVFAHKYEFVSNLSILDLLLNEGPISYRYLESISKGHE